MDPARLGNAPLASVVALAAGLAAAGCPRSNTPTPAPDAAVSLDAGVDSGRSGRDSGPRDSGPGWDVFADPGCDAGALPDGAVRDFSCDPLDPRSCGEELGCYAAAFPSEGPCGEETFRSYCLGPGPGGQGDRCREPTDCAPGYTCVVTGAGTQCAQVCDPSGGAPGCPRGWLCRGTDIPGYGVCF